MPIPRLLVAAAGLPGRRSSALMTHFNVLGLFKSHRW